MPWFWRVHFIVVRRNNRCSGYLYCSQNLILYLSRHLEKSFQIWALKECVPCFSSCHRLTGRPSGLARLQRLLSTVVRELPPNYLWKNRLFRTNSNKNKGTVKNNNSNSSEEGYTALVTVPAFHLTVVWKGKQGCLSHTLECFYQARRRFCFAYKRQTLLREWVWVG